MANAPNRGPCLGMRHVQSLLIFFDMIATCVCRWNISAALVAMTNAQKANPAFPEFSWNEKEISYIHSSFFWGYVVAQYPAGVLSRYYGTKILLGLSTLITAVLTASTPWCVNWGGWQAFCGLRVLQGLAQGIVFPCVFVHVAKWSPMKERNRLGAFAISGFDSGMVLAMIITGVIAKGPLGWPGVFYVSAGICLVWCVIWFIFGANCPTESKFITEIEKAYIQSSLSQTNDSANQKIPVPWKAVFTSAPFIVYLVAHCSAMWGISMFSAQIPLYLSGVLNMEVKSNALFSALPFLASWMMTYVFMVWGDILQHRNILTLASLRRLFNSIACWIPAACLIAIGFLDEHNKNMALTLMTIMVGLSSGNIIGSVLNIIDLTPNHTGILYSIINTVASLMAVIAPLVAGVIVTDMHNRFQWQIVFAISAVILFLGNLLYIIFVTTETQPWDAEDFLVVKDIDCPGTRQEESSQ